MLFNSRVREQELQVLYMSDFFFFLTPQPTHPVGCRQLQDLEIPHVEVDPCGDSQSAAEGAVLGLFEYDELKSKKKTRPTPQIYGRY